MSYIIYYVNNFHGSGVQAMLSSGILQELQSKYWLDWKCFPLEFRVFFQTYWALAKSDFHSTFIGLRSTGPRGYPQFSSMWLSPYTVHIIVAYIFKISRRVSTKC